MNTASKLTLRAVISLSLFTLALLFSAANSASAQADGEKLFKQRCSTCHNPVKRAIGPALKGARERIPQDDPEWIYKWVRNSAAVIASGDAYAVALYEEYNQEKMTSFNLTNEEIDAILDYADNYTEPTDTAGDGDGTTTTEGEEESNTSTFIWMLILGLVFIVVIRVAAGVKTSLKNLDREKQGLEPEADLNNLQRFYLWMSNHKKYTVVIGLAVLAIIIPKAWDFAAGIGVYTDYQPTQPIKFSHKIHAGQYEIACQYCHHSAEKGKHSGIPSANVCMNCHKGIQQGARWGEEEISKIYDAVGFDKEKLQYIEGYEQKPIKWVRIHNLPDFAYFNHSQHVVVGGVKCQECHGPVEEMDELYQFSPLTMGWCIDCHREKEVNFKDNGYYKAEHDEVVRKIQEEGLDAKVTVAKMGGLECAKCHY